MRRRGQGGALDSWPTNFQPCHGVILCRLYVITACMFEFVHVLSLLAKLYVCVTGSLCAITACMFVLQKVCVLSLLVCMFVLQKVYHCLYVVLQEVCVLSLLVCLCCRKFVCYHCLYVCVTGSLCVITACMFVLQEVCDLSQLHSLVHAA